MSTTNDSQPLTVAVNNFILDATVMLDLHDRLSIRFQIDLKLVRASVLIRLCILSISAVQSSTITLEQHLMENCCNVIVLTSHRQNGENVNIG